MKLIIDIPEEEYNHLKRTNDYSIEHTRYIYDGIPLEQISDEITELKNNNFFTEEVRGGLRMALNVIDKYRGDNK